MGGTTGTIVITNPHSQGQTLNFIYYKIYDFIYEGGFLLVQKGGKDSIMLAQLRVSHGSENYLQTFLKKTIMN